MSICILSIAGLCYSWIMPARMKLKKDSIEKAILIGLLPAVLVLSPMGGKIVLGLASYYIKKWWEKGGPYVPPEADPGRVRGSIYKLKRNDYIRWKIDKKKNIARVELTEKGKKILGSANIDDITIVKKDDWDGQWRFFLFDVPEKQRGLRDILRAKLKDLGFFQFQKSVWMYPFQCEEELRCLCEYMEATPYATMFTAKVDNDRILRRYFLRQGILLRRHLNLLDKGVRY